MTLPAWKYRDPAIVLEQQQERSCLDCAQLVVNEFAGARRFVCKKAVQKSSSDLYEMLRCGKYSNREIGMGVKDKVISALQSNSLKWDADFEKAIDRLTALGLSDPLGSALWRLKYVNDRAAGQRSLHLLTHKAWKLMPHVTQSYVRRLAAAAIKEWMLEACEKCGGRGKITEVHHVSTCSKCEGSGIKKYSDMERALAVGIPPESWKGHAKHFDKVAGCLYGSAASTSGRVSELLKRGDE